MFVFLLILLILDAFVLVAVVLLQAGQGGGLAAMSGGASTDTFLGGRQAVTILTKMSWWCGGIFLALSLVLAGLSARGSRARSVLEGQIQAPLPVAPLPLNVQPAAPAASGGAAPTGKTAVPTAPIKPGGRD
jgi:preprotein translocase subunit SecG